MAYISGKKLKNNRIFVKILS